MASTAGSCSACSAGGDGTGARSDVVNSAPRVRSGVTFIAWVGVRQLATASLELIRRGEDRLVLLRPAELVLDILRAAGVMDLMTIVHREREASPALAADRG